jgi:tetratricopeptide (TPR) repeat protein
MIVGMATPAESQHSEVKQTPAVSPRTGLALAAVVFVVALAVRLIYAAQSSTFPLFQYPTIDAGVYYLLARDFAHGNWLYPMGEPYWQPPFYSAVLAVWMMIAGEAVRGAQNAQFVIGSINCSLIFALGSRLFGRRVGLVAGIMAALYAPMIYFDGELLTPTVQIFLNLSAILLLLRGVQQSSLTTTILAGILCGLSVITRPDVVVFVAVAAVWTFLALRDRLGLRRALAAAAALLVSAALPVVPVAVRNRVVGKDPTLISYNGGINFYIGNNPRYDEVLSIRPGPDWDKLVAEPTRSNPKATPSQQCGYFYAKSMSYIRSQPLDWVKLMLRKSVTYLTAVEGRRNHDMYFARRYSPLFSALLFRAGPFAFPLGVVLPLALLGALRRPRNRETALVLLYIGAMFVVTVAFFVVARYRVTAAPVMIVFAASGAAELWRMVRWKRFHAAPVAAAALLLVVCNLNLPGVDRDRRVVDADSHYFVAGILGGDGKELQAIPEYERSIRLNPRFYMSRMNYGRMLLEMGRLKDAVRQLEAANSLSRSAELDWLLGEAYRKLPSHWNALMYYEDAARRDPRYIDGLAHLGQDVCESGDHAFAAKVLAVVIKLRPDYAQAHYALGVALMRLNRTGEAVDQFRKASEQDPSSAEPLMALGIALDRYGRRAEAKEAFDRAEQVGPRDEILQRIRQYYQRRDRNKR